MTKRNWVGGGLKLLGVYFAVTGIADATRAVGVFYSLPMAWPTARGLIWVMSQMLGPAVYVITACILLCCTEWCLRTLGCSSRDDADNEE